MGVLQTTSRDFDTTENTLKSVEKYETRFCQSILNIFLRRCYSLKNLQLKLNKFNELNFWQQKFAVVTRLEPP